jgi:hypothetical protein
MKNQDLMEYLGCSYTTIEKLRASNKLPYKKVMGTYYYSIDEVNRVFCNDKLYNHRKHKDEL